MRKTYRKIPTNHFYTSLICTRHPKRLTPSPKADTLTMDDRSYLDLEKTCCSATTLALFLVYVCDDVKLSVEGLSHAFETGSDEAA